MYLNNITYELEQYVNPNPVMTIGGVSIINAMSPKNITERVMRITAGSGFGFVDVSTSKKWFMRISNKLDYEISFWFKQPNTVQPCFELSFNGFDCNDNQLNSYESSLGAIDNRWVKSTDKVLTMQNKWYFARFCLFNSSFVIQPSQQPSTSLSVGQNLILNPNTVNIIVNLLCRNSELYMYDFKVKPLSTPFSTGFVQGSELLEIWRKNNNKTLNDEKIDKIANNILLPYDSSNISIKL